MKVSILSGVATDANANFIASPPVNMEPVIGENGLSGGYLRTAPGLATLGPNGPGLDRGSQRWFDSLYRVMGTKLVYIVLTVPITLGDVGSGGPVSFDYSVDYLAIASGGRLYLYSSGSGLTQVTDPNLGTVLDVIWIDGYFMTTDGNYLVVTNLDDPFTVNPLKYGSSEADPDPIVALRRIRDEVYAINLTTIENFQNVGGSGFPFRRNPSGLIPKGACGTHAVADFLDSFAFVGGGRNEAPSVYIAGYGTAERLGTPMVDRELAAMQPADRALIEVESIQEKAEQKLLVHLGDKTLVYYRQASIAAEQPVWTVLRGGANLDQPYPARHFSYAENVWIGGTSTGQLGYLSEVTKTHFGAPASCRFDTAFLYSEGRGAILGSVELTGLPGRSAVLDPQGMLSWTRDGLAWSAELPISLGGPGDTQRRMQWRPKIRFANYLGLRFRLPSDSIISFARLDVNAEPLNG